MGIWEWGIGTTGMLEWEPQEYGNGDLRMGNGNPGMAPGNPGVVPLKPIQIPGIQECSEQGKASHIPNIPSTEQDSHRQGTEFPAFPAIPSIPSREQHWHVCPVGKTHPQFPVERNMPQFPFFPPFFWGGGILGADTDSGAEYTTIPILIPGATPSIIPGFPQVHTLMVELCTPPNSQGCHSRSSPLFLFFWGMLGADADGGAAHTTPIPSTIPSPIPSTIPAVIPAVMPRCGR